MSNPNNPLPLVLASSSVYRKALLERLGLSFHTASPTVDESPKPGESPEALVLRLAEAKASAVAKGYSSALIIGSDQVACIDDMILGKPGTRERAIEQLVFASGKQVRFLTGLCLLNVATGQMQTLCEPFSVHFRSLSKSQIERYLDAEQPFDCAGSFKSEGLGIALFERMEGKDPNALIGLPLIQLIKMLSKEGIEVP